MLKELFIAGALLLSAAPFLAHATNQDAWLPFDKEYVFAAEILMRSEGLEYWALPMPEDEKGYAAATAMVQHMQSILHRVNPLVIPISLSGIRYDYNNGKSLAKDDFINKVENDLNTIGSKKLAYVRCTGRYSGRNVAFCVVTPESGRSLQQDLLSKGYVTLSDNPREAPRDIYPHLKAAESEAQQDEIGIWVPFYFMMKGF